MSIRYRLLLLSTAFLASVALAEPLRVTVHLPARVEDGAALFATVTLTNTSAQPLTVYAPDTTTVQFHFEQHLDFGTGKWVQQLIGGHSLQPNHPLIPLAPAQSTSAQVQALNDYPFGLAPGEYSVRAIYQLYPDVKGLSWYGAAQSAPASVTIAAPQTPGYEAFLRASRAAAAHDTSAVSLAFDFARAHPEHPYAQPLLVALLSTADAAKADQIVSFMKATYPSSAYTEQATILARAVQQRDNDHAAYEKHIATMKAYANTHPDIHAAAARSVGTVLDARGFDRAEAFIRQYPDSPYAAQALWLMIDGVNHGALPAGKTSADRDHVLADLYRRLLRYPDNYWARRAARDPSVSALLRQTE